VEPTGNGSADAFHAISREILSRSRLGHIINDFGLYADLRAKGASVERLTERLRKEIKIEPIDVNRFEEPTAFKIVFRAETAGLAQSVTGRLASLFIEENLKRRSGQAATTTRFLEDRIEAARQQLAKQEEKIRDYKRLNLEGLPQQQQALLASITDLRAQLQTTNSGIVRIQQQRSAIQSLLGNHIGILQADRQALLTRFTVKHPEVARKDQEIARGQVLYERLQSGNSMANAVPTEVGLDTPQLAQLRAQVEASVSDMENVTREQRRLAAEIARQQSTLRMTPVREQELTEILRDYDLYKKDYDDLLSKKLNAQLSATLEERNEGQQFRLVDPPILPTAPSWPKRMQISLGGIAGGIVFGILLGIFVDMRASVFHTETEVRNKYDLPIVTAVPYVHTPREESRRRWKRLGEWSAGVAVVLLILATEAYVYWNQ
jgi:polysaccharide chain length determinant protein (PEP-CTERM system associated)